MEEKTNPVTSPPAPVPPPQTPAGGATELQNASAQWAGLYPMYTNYNMAPQYYHFMNAYPQWYQSALYQQQAQMLDKPQESPIKFVPPLPPGPPLPNSTPPPHISKPPLLNTPLKQFNNPPIRFNLNFNGQKRLNSPVNTSVTSGAAKKKRKRNRNNQLNNLPPLPPSPDAIPKPPIQPPLPPLPDTTQPPPPPDQPSAVAAANNPADDWPPSLKDYVNRCYAKCETNIDKNQVEIILKGKITHAYQMGQLHTKDWGSEPLPSVHSERPKLAPKTVPGQLAQFQNNSKKGLSPAMGARLGVRASTIRGKSRSKSRSRSPRKRSRSPRRRRSSG